MYEKVELAVGVVIGSSFGAIVNSLVVDIITPLISLITAGADFTYLSINLNPNGEPLLLNYGNFIQASITFLLTTFAIFVMIKILNRIANKKAEPEVEEAPAAPSDEAVILQRILDQLEEKNNA